MSQVLSLELSDEVYAALQEQAEVAGVSLAELVAISIEQQYGSLTCKKPPTETDKEAARQRFRSHAGSINIGYATGADNESIDGDLIKAYSDTTEETPIAILNRKTFDACYYLNCDDF